MKLLRIFFVSLAAAALVGCQSTGPSYVPPDFKFPTADARKAKGALALQFTESGWRIERETETTIVFRTGQYDAGLAGALVTCGGCPPPEVEAEMIVAPFGKETTVRFNLAWIANPKTFREQRIVPQSQRGPVTEAVETHVEWARKKAGGRGPAGIN